METIGNRISKKRKERGLNQAELAKVVNKSKQVISNWERGYSKPVDDDLLSLSLALGVSSDYLLGIESKKPSFSKLDLADDTILERVDLYFEGKPINETAFKEAMNYLRVKNILK